MRATPPAEAAAAPDIDSNSDHSTNVKPTAPTFTWSIVALYGSPAVGPSLLGMWVLLFYMNFATDVLLIAPSVIGSIFLLSKVWDAVSDPFAGYMSDRTKSRLGRRRSWMLGSALPIPAAALMMWAPPASLTGRELEIWVGVGVFLFYTAYTAYYVPHLSLGSELTTDGNVRNRFFASRNIAYSIGLMLSVVAGGIVFNSEDPRSEAWVFALVIGALTTLSIINASLRLPNEPARIESGSNLSLLSSMRDVARNPHARILLFVYFVESVGLGATGTMTPYAVKYIVKVPEILTSVMAASFIPAMVTIPIWVRIARRFERHHLWMVSMGLASIGYGCLFFLDEGRIWLMYTSSLFTGTAMGCSTTLGHSIKADVIDHDELVTGQRKDGSYFAALSFIQKLGSGAMVGISGLVLGGSGFVANSANQLPETLEAILFFMGGAPFLGMVAGLIAMTRFRLNRAAHTAIRNELDARHSG